MSEAFASDDRMTLEAFEAFTKDRPHWERWELIDGEMTMQATPAKRHQLIIENLLFHLGAVRRDRKADWRAIGGIGTRLVSDNHNEIIPDVMILPPGDDLSNWTYDVMVAVEVLSPGSVRRDLVVKHAIYQRMPMLTHYIVVAQHRRDVTVFARADKFCPQQLTSDDVLEIPQLGIAIPLAEIYRDIPLG